MRHCRRLQLLASIALGLADCGESSSRLTSRSLDLSLVARISSEGGGKASQFTAIRTLVENGNQILVLDEGDDRVKLFDTTGAFVGSIGGRGGGPGEFLGGVWTMGVALDTIWVIDGALRIHYFSRAGKVIRQTKFDRLSEERASSASGTPYYYAVPQVVAPGYGVLGFGGYLATQARRGEVVRKPLLAFSREGATRDTIGWIGTERTDLLFPSGPALIQPFADDPLVVYRPNSAITYVIHRAASTNGDRAAFRVVTLAGSGDTLRDQAYPYKPRRVSDAVADSVRRSMARRLPMVATSELQKRLYVPKYEVPIIDAVAGTRCLWLRRELTTDSTVYAVVSDTPSGRVRRAALPAKSRVLWASGSHIWSERLDEDDVPTLERWQINEVC